MEANPTGDLGVTPQPADVVEFRETPHPEHYLSCSKILNGKSVVTGWAPDLRAAGRHAIAVGGDVVVHDKNGNEVSRFSDSFELTVNVRAAMELVYDSLASSEEPCYSDRSIGNEDQQGSR